MPLFKKHHDNEPERNAGRTRGVDAQDQNGGDGYTGGQQGQLGNDSGSGAYNGSNQTSTGRSHHRHGDHAHAHGDPTYPSPNAPVADQDYGTAVDGYGNNTTGMGNGARGSGTGAVDASGHTAPAAAAGHTHGQSSFVGKVETALGTVLGSQELKLKGEQKQQEAAALHAQASHLTEAEKLEQAAVASRQRAVAAGAHPDHGHLGGHNPGAGAPNVNELGGGANIGVGGVGGASSTSRPL